MMKTAFFLICALPTLLTATASAQTPTPSHNANPWNDLLNTNGSGAFQGLSCFGVTDSYLNAANALVNKLEDEVNQRVSETASLLNFEVGNEKFGLLGTGSLGKIEAPQFDSKNPTEKSNSGFPDLGLAPAYTVNALVFGHSVSIIDVQMSAGQSDKSFEGKERDPDAKKGLAVEVRILGITTSTLKKAGAAIKAVRAADGDLGEALQDPAVLAIAQQVTQTANGIGSNIAQQNGGQASISLVDESGPTLPQQDDKGTKSKLLDINRSVFGNTPPSIPIIPPFLVVQVDAGFVLQSSLVLSYQVDSILGSFSGSRSVTGKKNNPATEDRSIKECDDDGQNCKTISSSNSPKSKEFWEKFPVIGTAMQGIERVSNLRDSIKDLKTKEATDDAKITHSLYVEWKHNVDGSRNLNRIQTDQQEQEIYSRMPVVSVLRPQGNDCRTDSNQPNPAAVSSGSPYSSPSLSNNHSLDQAARVVANGKLVYDTGRQLYKQIKQITEASKDGFPKVTGKVGVSINGSVGIWARAVLSAGVPGLRGFAGVEGSLTLIDITLGLGVMASTKSQYLDITTSVDQIRMLGALDFIYGVRIGFPPIGLELKGTQNITEFDGTFSNDHRLAARFDFKPKDKRIFFACWDKLGEVDTERCADPETSISRISPELAAHAEFKRVVLNEPVLDSNHTCFLASGGQPFYSSDLNVSSCNNLIPTDGNIPLAAITTTEGPKKHPIVAAAEINGEYFLSLARTQDNRPFKTFVSTDALGNESVKTFTGPALGLSPSVGGLFQPRDSLAQFGDASVTGLNSSIYTLATLGTEMEIISSGKTAEFDADSARSAPALHINIPSQFPFAAGQSFNKIYVGDLISLNNDQLIYLSQRYKLGRCKIDSAVTRITVAGNPYPRGGEPTGSIAENLENPTLGCEIPAVGEPVNVNSASAKPVFAGCMLRKALVDGTCFPADRVVEFIALANMSDSQVIEGFLGNPKRISGRIEPGTISYGNQLNSSVVHQPQRWNNNSELMAFMDNFSTHGSDNRYVQNESGLNPQVVNGVSYPSNSAVLGGYCQSAIPYFQSFDTSNPPSQSFMFPDEVKDLPHWLMRVYNSFSNQYVETRFYSRSRYQAIQIQSGNSGFSPIAVQDPQFYSSYFHPTAFPDPKLCDNTDPNHRDNVTPNRISEINATKGKGINSPILAAAIRDCVFGSDTGCKYIPEDSDVLTNASCLARIRLHTGPGQGVSSNQLGANNTWVPDTLTASTLAISGIGGSDTYITSQELNGGPDSQSIDQCVMQTSAFQSPDLLCNNPQVRQKMINKLIDIDQYAVWEPVPGEYTAEVEINWSRILNEGSPLATQFTSRRPLGRCTFRFGPPLEAFGGVANSTSTNTSSGVGSGTGVGSGSSTQTASNPTNSSVTSANWTISEIKTASAVSNGSSVSAGTCQLRVRPTVSLQGATNASVFLRSALTEASAAGISSNGLGSQGANNSGATSISPAFACRKALGFDTEMSSNSSVNFLKQLLSIGNTCNQIDPSAATAIRKNFTLAPGINQLEVYAQFTDANGSIAQSRIGDCEIKTEKLDEIMENARCALKIQSMDGKLESLIQVNVPADTSSSNLSRIQRCTNIINGLYNNSGELWPNSSQNRCNAGLSERPEFFAVGSTVSVGQTQISGPNSPPISVKMKAMLGDTQIADLGSCTNHFRDISDDERGGTVQRCQLLGKVYQGQTTTGSALNLNFSPASMGFAQADWDVNTQDKCFNEWARTVRADTSAPAPKPLLCRALSDDVKVALGYARNQTWTSAQAQALPQGIIATAAFHSGWRSSASEGNGLITHPNTLTSCEYKIARTLRRPVEKYDLVDKDWVDGTAEFNTEEALKVTESHCVIQKDTAGGIGACASLTNGSRYLIAGGGGAVYRELAPDSPTEFSEEYKQQFCAENIATMPAVSALVQPEPLKRFPVWSRVAMGKNLIAPSPIEPADFYCDPPKCEMMVEFGNQSFQTQVGWRAKILALPSSNEECVAYYREQAQSYCDQRLSLPEMPDNLTVKLSASFGEAKTEVGVCLPLAKSRVCQIGVRKPKTWISWLAGDGFLATDRVHLPETPSRSPASTLDENALIFPRAASLNECVLEAQFLNQNNAICSKPLLPPEQESFGSGSGSGSGSTSGMSYDQPGYSDTGWNSDSGSGSGFGSGSSSGIGSGSSSGNGSGSSSGFLSFLTDIDRTQPYEVALVFGEFSARVATCTPTGSGKTGVTIVNGDMSVTDQTSGSSGNAKYVGANDSAQSVDNATQAASGTDGDAAVAAGTKRDPSNDSSGNTDFVSSNRVSKIATKDVEPTLSVVKSGPVEDTCDSYVKVDEYKDDAIIEIKVCHEGDCKETGGQLVFSDVTKGNIPYKLLFANDPDLSKINQISNYQIRQVLDAETFSEWTPMDSDFFYKIYRESADKCGFTSVDPNLSSLKTTIVENGCDSELNTEGTKDGATLEIEVCHQDECEKDRYQLIVSEKGTGNLSLRDLFGRDQGVSQISEKSRYRTRQVLSAEEFSAWEPIDSTQILEIYHSSAEKCEFGSPK